MWTRVVRHTVTRVEAELWVGSEVLVQPELHSETPDFIKYKNRGREGGYRVCGARGSARSPVESLNCPHGQTNGQSGEWGEAQEHREEGSLRLEAILEKRKVRSGHSDVPTSVERPGMWVFMRVLPI